ncbi:hypothetical protein [Kibdelosporangium aridum]|uniref:hypothetical protein n=1 Tax=Kibdelosporangium aridum TaxID=2030 RepID=UPI000AA4315A|nr:hypothetical protein [Kibdelosporangium aridum]
MPARKGGGSRTPALVAGRPSLALVDLIERLGLVELLDCARYYAKHAHPEQLGALE